MIKKLFNKIFKFETTPEATIIAAVDMYTNGIGFEGTLSWKIPSDMECFKKTTSLSNNKKIKNILICGRVTYESFGSKPLPNRHFIVLTKDPDRYFRSNFKIFGDSKHNLIEGSVNQKNDVLIMNTGDGRVVIYTNSLDHLDYCLKRIKKDYGLGKIFVIGGSKIYKEFLTKDIKGLKLTRCLITEIDSFKSDSITNIFENRFDTYFPMKEMIDNFEWEKLEYLEKGVTLRSYKLKRTPDVGKG